VLRRHVITLGTDRPEGCDRENGVPVRDPTGGSNTMLWTILIVLAIIALALFIVGQMRGRRGL
jgi:hypothetical protein